MPDFRDLLLARCIELAPLLGNCPDCHGLGVRQGIAGTHKTDDDLVYSAGRCPRCNGTRWVRSRTLAVRLCVVCDRPFQPVGGLDDGFLLCCTWCRRDWLRATPAQRRAGRNVSPSHRRASGYVGAEAQPSASSGGTSANDSVGAGWASPTGGPSDAKLNSQIRTAQPGSQDGRGRKATRRQGPPLAQDRAGRQGAATRPGGGHRAADRGAAYHAARPRWTGNH